MFTKKKIDHISKLKIIAKRILELKYPFQNIMHLLRGNFIFLANWLNFERPYFTKTKNRKFIFHSFQHIIHLSCKYGHLWEERDLHILTWDGPTSVRNRKSCFHRDKNSKNTFFIRYRTLCGVLISAWWFHHFQNGITFC